jgi:putative ABC transport system substrate-binding protein
MMDRRRFLLTSLAGAVAVPRVARAQQAGKVWRLGVLDPGVAVSDAAWWKTPFAEQLHHLGYVNGHNLIVERRHAGGRIDQLPELAADLVRLKVDVLFTNSTPGVEAARTATKSIPIVFIAVGDPVGTGLVRTLAHPGENITGISAQLRELGGKQLQLLKEFVPSLSRVAVLWNPANAGSAIGLRDMEHAARPLGIQIRALAIRDAAELEAAFAALAQDRSAGALVVHPVAPMWEHRARIMEFAVNRRMIAVSSFKQMAEAGALAIYGSDLREQGRLAADYVDKILKGAKVGDLPVQQPTKFELVINLKTAKALGLTIPPSLLLQADQIIE